MVRPLPSGWIEKPRPLYWEWLLLAGESPFRALLQSAFAKSTLVSPFSYLPNLVFDSNQTEILVGGGRVQNCRFLGLQEPTIELSEQESEGAGAILALLAWLGVTDLHRDNIWISRDPATGRLAILPVDIECVWNRLRMPHQTHLLSSTAAPGDIAGYWVITNAVKNDPERLAAPFISGYMESLTVLSRYQETIESTAFKLYSNVNCPIRIIARPTRHYVAALKKADFSGMADCEVAQLVRGDIPYFFRYLTSKDMWFYASPGLAEPADFSHSYHEHLVRECLLLGQGDIDSSRATDLLQAGTLSILRDLSGDLSGTHQYKECYVTVRPEIFRVNLGNIRIVAQRDTGASAHLVGKVDGN